MSSNGQSCLLALRRASSCAEELRRSVECIAGCPTAAPRPPAAAAAPDLDGFEDADADAADNALSGVPAGAGGAPDAEAVFESVLESVALHAQASDEDTKDVADAAAAAVQHLTEGDRDAVEAALVSCAMQLVQAPPPQPGAPPGHRRSYQRFVSTLHKLFRGVRDEALCGVLWAYLRDTAMATGDEASLRLYSPAHRAAALRAVLGVFVPERSAYVAGTVLCDHAQGMLFDGAAEIRRAALSAVTVVHAALMNSMQLEEDANGGVRMNLVGQSHQSVLESVAAKLEKAVIDVCLLDPTASVRKQAADVVYASFPFNAAVLRHKMCDKDKSVRVAALRHVSSLASETVMHNIEALRLPGVLSVGLSSSDATEAKACGCLLSSLVNNASDVAGLLVSLDVCTHHATYDTVLKAEISRAIAAA